MKIRIVIVAILALFFHPGKALAQMDERAPGIYTVVNGESRHLTYSSCGWQTGNGGIGGVEVGRSAYNFKGLFSNVDASDTFVLVVNPRNRIASRSLRKYDPFIRNLTPVDILVIPLSLNLKKERREYDGGMTVGGIEVGEGSARLSFDWEQISENSFEIKVKNLVPGEYGFIFRYSKLAGFDYGGIYGFTIPEPEEIKSEEIKTDEVKTDE